MERKKPKKKQRKLKMNVSNPSTDVNFVERGNIWIASVGLKG